MDFLAEIARCELGETHAAAFELIETSAVVAEERHQRRVLRRGVDELGTKRLSIATQMGICHVQTRPITAIRSENACGERGHGGFEVGGLSEVVDGHGVLQKKEGTPARMG